MKTSVKVIIGLIAAVAIGSGIYLTMNNSEEPSSTSSGSTITYTDNGFSPSTLTVPTGTTITVKNDSSEELDFQSDPHPVHTNNSELNQEDLPAGESQTFTVTTAGTWGYHNHHDPDKKGTIIVE